jgi:hypothetical protein
MRELCERFYHVQLREQQLDALLASAVSSKRER